MRIEPLGLLLALGGTVVVIYLSMRTLLSALHVRSGTEAPDEVGTPARAFATALVATETNPSNIASWAAISGHVEVAICP